MPKKIFTPKDIKTIQQNTHWNNNTENYIFIAKKINSPLVKEFRQIQKEHEKAGYLPYELSQRRYKAYKKLMQQVQKKVSKEEYEKVYGAT